MTNQELEIWLSIPEVAELLDVRLRDVRALVVSNELLAVRRGESNALAIHRDQLVIEDGQWCPLASLRGTITALKDAGLNDADALSWLLATSDELDEIPLQALHAGRVHAVRRACQMLAL